MLMEDSFTKNPVIGKVCVMMVKRTENDHLLGLEVVLEDGRHPARVPARQLRVDPLEVQRPVLRPRVVGGQVVEVDVILELSENLPGGKTS